ncbi:MFS transporter [Candidatus Poseidonia alphae]|nr:MFS transporter [Candidatus Poseidonia alphae]
MKVSIEQRQAVAFRALIAAFFVNFLGYAFIVPILPSWQTQFDINATQATLLVSLWAVPMFLMGPMSGRITDRFGAGTTILTSLILLTISSGVYLLATNEWLPHPFLALCFARLLHGASGATIMTAGLAAASQLWPTRFGEQAGKLLGIAAIGGLLGPVFGGILFAWGEASAFGFLGLVTFSVIPFIISAGPSLGKAHEPSLGGFCKGIFHRSSLASGWNITGHHDRCNGCSRGWCSFVFG